LQLRLPETLRRYSVLSCSLLALAIVALLLFWKVLHWGDPYDYLILPNYWIDLNIYRPVFADFGTHHFFDMHGTASYQYPAPVALLYGLMYALPAGARGMQALIVVVVLTAAICLFRAMVRRGASAGSAGLFVALAVVSSFPMWFELRVLNTEIFLFAIGMLAFYAFHKQWYSLCGMLVGLDVAFKVYPLLFLLLLLLHKKYKAMAIALLTAAIVTVVGLLYVTPADTRYTLAGLLDSQASIQRNIASYSGAIYASVVGNRWAMYDHAFWASLKLVFLKGLHLQHPRGLLYGYYVVALVAGVVIYWTRLRVLPVVNQVICLTTAAAFLTPSSFDYTLLWLYIGWATLVLFAVEQRDAPVKGLGAALTCYAIILSFLSEFIVHEHGLAGPIRTIAAAVLFYNVLRYPFQGTSTLPQERRTIVV
jgi:hypothetical protein